MAFRQPDPSILPRPALIIGEDRVEAGSGEIVAHVYPGTGHAFMGPHNALGTLNEERAGQIWPEVLAFLHETLG